MKDLIISLIVLAILCLAIYYIVRQKKNGTKCIGCPSGGCCLSQKGSSCNCSSETNNN